MKQGPIIVAAVVAAGLAWAVVSVGWQGEDDGQAQASPNPVIAVALVRPQRASWPVRIPATGNIAAWQEASVGAEANGLRLEQVNVNVGDTVLAGQVLARFDANLMAAELAEAQAALAQAQAQWQEAEANATRARLLDGSGVMSAQQVNQYVVAAVSAQARVQAARAVVDRQRLRLAQTRVLAPSDGVISARMATVGAVVPAGQELFRLIRDARLEWRASVPMAELYQLEPGQVASVQVLGAAPVRGTLRVVAPAIDARTHDGLVYIDLPRASGLRAGAFARGEIEIGDSQALSVPQAAVLLRDGFHYVMRVGPHSKVMLDKVEVGRRQGTRIEIRAGLTATDQIIASGLGLLSDGDSVRVVSR